MEFLQLSAEILGSTEPISRPQVSGQRGEILEPPAQVVEVEVLEETVRVALAQLSATVVVAGRIMEVEMEAELGAEARGELVADRR